MSFNTSTAQHLEDLKWKNRVLIVKSSASENQLFLKQLKAFEKDKKGMIERKLVIYSIQKDSLSFTDFSSEKQKQLNYNNGEEFTHKPFENNSVFEVILIGLDGSIKRRQNAFLSLKDLFALIDGMPMRIEELRGEN